MAEKKVLLKLNTKALTGPGQGLLKINIGEKLENFFKKHVYSGGYMANDAIEKLFDYGEASRACYKVKTKLSPFKMSATS